MWILLPVPLGAWGAAVAGFTAIVFVPNFAVPAFFAGSFVAMLQMGWFVPLYVSAVSIHGVLRVSTLFGAALLAVPLGFGSIFFVAIGASLLNGL